MFYGIPGGCQAPTRSQNNSMSKAQESVHSDKALSENYSQNNLESMQPPPEEGKHCSAVNAIHYCFSLRGRRLSPHKKASKIRFLHSTSHHSRCLDLCDRGRGGFSALSFTCRKSPQKSCSQNKGTDGRVAWMTLDGLLVNVDDTISNEMGKILGNQETVAWNGFTPLQKVLLVAITAAAASAAKQRHTKDMRCLQLAIAERDKDSEILREKISQLQEHLSFWKEQAQNFCEDVEGTGKVISDSPLFKLGLESTPKCDSMMLAQFATPKLEQGLVRMPDHIARFRKNLRAASFKNHRELGAHLSNESWNMNAVEDNNEKRTFLDWLSESPSVIERQLTPQTPFTQLNHISTPSHDVSSKQVGRLSQYCQKGCQRVNDTENSSMSCVPSTELILQLKEQLSESQTIVNENCIRTDKNDERLSRESDQSLTTSVLSRSENNEGDDTNVDSAIQVAVRNTVDDLLAPLSERKHFFNHTWSSDMVIEQLLGELENAAAKVASMEAEIKSLRDSEMLCERKEAERHLAEVRLNLDMVSQGRALQSEVSAFQDFRQSELPGFHTCKELETTLELLKDTEKRLASCGEACKKKDDAISRLEDEVAALQVMVSELRSLQATPKVVCQQDPSPVQTFLTSNLLFNLDSPVKIDSPFSAKSSFSSWKGLDELSRVSDSLERESRESMRGSCDSEIYRLECDRAWQLTDGNKEEPDCLTSVLRVARATNNNKHTMTRETAEESRKHRSNEEVRRSSSSTEEPLRKSSSSSNTDERVSVPVRHGRLPQVPKSHSSHARKLKFSNAADSRFPDDKGGIRAPSPVEAGGGRRDDSSLTIKASNVLAGVEPNTPMSYRKFNRGGKDNNKILSHSLDSLNKAKENFVHRRRWM